MKMSRRPGFGYLIAGATANWDSAFRWERCISLTRSRAKVGTTPTRARPFVSLSVHQVHDVSIRILEPGNLHVAADVDVAFDLEARHVVVLEGHTFGLESPNDLFDLIADHPRDGGGLVGSGVLRSVHVEPAVAGLVNDQLASLAGNGDEAERFFVELLGDVDVFHRDVRDRVLVTQHVELLRSCVNRGRSCKIGTSTIRSFPARLELRASA